MAILVGLEVLKLQHNFVYFRFEMKDQKTTAQKSDDDNEEHVSKRSRHNA